MENSITFNVFFIETFPKLMLGFDKIKLTIIADLYDFGIGGAGCKENGLRA